jgi:hypothetical protein
MDRRYHETKKRMSDCGEEKEERREKRKKCQR